MKNGFWFGIKIFFESKHKKKPTFKWTSIYIKEACSAAMIFLNHFHKLKAISKRLSADDIDKFIETK